MTANVRNICVSMCGGGSLIGCRPIFTANSRYLVCASGSVVQIYSTDNDVCCRTLRGHQSTVTCLLTNPTNEFQILSCSVDKSIVCWDYVEGVQLRRYTLPWPIWSVHPATCENRSSLYAVLQSDAKADNCILVDFDVRELRTQGGKVNFRKLHRGVSSDPQLTAVGLKGAFLAFVKNNYSIVVVKTENPTKARQITSPQPIICIACSPSGYCFATGCKGGKIYLWQNILSDSPVSTVLHWHALDVNSLVFSMSGSYLLSGGHECVLVKWMTELTTDKPETLPRLGYAIASITCSPDNQLYAVSFADNGIQIIGNNFHRGPIIQGLARSHVVPGIASSARCRLVYDTRSKSLVLNGRPGQLQFFGVDNNRQLMSLNIVGHNFVSPENLDNPLIQTDVEIAQFDYTGNWLATFEWRDDGDTAVEARLKFWQFSIEKNSFVLNTCIDSPHLGKMKALKFGLQSSNGDSKGTTYAASSSVDGTVKIWSLIEEDSLGINSIRWSCMGIGSYRGLPAGAMDFSEDGSILAVAFSDVITLWYPQYCCLHDDIISVAGSACDIQDLCFGQGKSSHLIVFYTSDSLYCFDMLSFSIRWCLSIHVRLLIADAFSENMAVFTVKKQLLIVSPSMSSNPVVYKHHKIQQTVVDACFVPNVDESHSVEGALSWQSKSRLYFVTADQELYSLFYNEECNVKQKSVASLQQQGAMPQNSLLNILMATESGPRSAVSRNIEPGAGHTLQTKSKILDEFINDQLIALPPIRMLCKSFVESLLITKSDGAGEDVDELDTDPKSKSFTDVSDESDMDVL